MGVGRGIEGCSQLVETGRLSREKRMGLAVHFRSMLEKDIIFLLWLATFRLIVYPNYLFPSEFFHVFNFFSFIIPKSIILSLILLFSHVYFLGTVIYSSEIFLLGPLVLVLILA
jgi:hypothetical protein